MSITDQVIYAPKYVTGIDDIATMNAWCSGWTIVSFDYHLFDYFEKEASKILQNANLQSFHGKEFKRKKSDSYLEFLKLIRSMLERGPGFICCTLLGQDWKTEFEYFCDRVIDGSFSDAGIECEAITNASKKVAAPLFTYQRLAGERCHGGSTLIYIDRHAVLDPLNFSKLQVHEKQMPAQLPIVAALRAYGRNKFPNAPEIERDGITICPDEDSYLVQAADIIGNFSTAFAFRHLGKISAQNDLKSELFEQAFADVLDLSGALGQIRISGNDLVLKEGASSFTFCIA